MRVEGKGVVWVADRLVNMHSVYIICICNNICDHAMHTAIYMSACWHISTCLHYKHVRVVSSFWNGKATRSRMYISIYSYTRTLKLYYICTLYLHYWTRPLYMYTFCCKRYMYECIYVCIYFTYLLLYVPCITVCDIHTYITSLRIILVLVYAL